MTRIMAGLWAGVLAALVVGASVAAEPGGYDDAEHAQRLAAALQAKVTELPVAAVNTALNAVTFNTLVLTDTRTVVNGKSCYAFRFRTPATPGGLKWSFQLPPGLESWYICPAAGTMKGFTTFTDKRLLLDVEGVGKKGDRFILQSLDESRLKRDTEYIMWFQFGAAQPVSVTCSLNVVAGERVYVSDVFPYFWTEEERAPVPGR